MKKQFTFLVLFLLFHIGVIAQVGTVTGRVTDSETGMPVPAANVIEKGTSNGVITNFEGEFSINVPADAILEISYLGFAPTEVPVNGRTNIQVTMEPMASELDQVVVVGYGTQRRGSVIGAVSQVNSEEIENRSVTNLTEALTGQMPGVTIIQRTGRPGYNAGEISIRGVGSFGADPSALVLIDGLPGDLNNINPNDVESVSVLKDAATAAVYGSRAANGVILVTTKTGREGQLRINYNGYVGVQRATELPELVNSWEYAELYNEAIGREVYTPEEIELYRSGSDPDNYPNTDFIGSVFSRNPVQTSHNLQLSGGNTSTQYVVSLGFLNQLGLTERNDYTRYNLRVNLINDIGKNFTLTTRLSGVSEVTNEPLPPGPEEADWDDIITNSVREPAIWAGRLSNGYFGAGRTNTGTPISNMASESFHVDKPYSLKANMQLDWQAIENLTLSLIGGYNQTTRLDKIFLASQQLTESILLGPPNLTQLNTNAFYKTFQALAEYDRKFGDHNFNILGGYSFEDNHFERLSGYRQLSGNSLTELDAGSSEGQSVSGNANEWALQSFFGRLRYDFENKYLFESTMRYDGSSRFPTAQKYGFFPSAAIGWRVSEEDFFNVQSITDLKLKASYGILGNQNIGNYPYQNILSTQFGYVFGGTYYPGVAATRLTDPNLHWESTSSFNTGFDVTLGNELDLNVNYFNRRTYDILYQPSASVSAVLGKDLSETNTGSLRNSGWEFAANYRKLINTFSFNISPNLTILKNEVLDLGVGNVTQPNGLVGNGTDLFIGHPMHSYYGYVANGLYVDENDIANGPDVSRVNPEPVPGDIKYADLSGPDGVPDGQVDANYDRTVLGSRIPKYSYGLSLGADFKGFDFSALVQGVAEVSGKLDRYAGLAFNNTSSIQRWMAEERWTPDNPDPNAGYPRLEISTNAGTPNTEQSSFWILDASYVRLRNVQLGYSLPSTLLENFRLEGLRIYASGENLYTWKTYRQGWDPEINSDGGFYPIFANFTVGLNVNF